MSKKYRYRVRVTYDAILESDFPDDFTESDVIENEKEEVEAQDVLYFGSDFDPEVIVSDVHLVSRCDEYDLLRANSEVANILVGLRVANNLNCDAEVEVSYSVDSCDDGSYDIMIEKFDIVSTEFYDDNECEVEINVDVKPLIDSTKLEEKIRSYLDRGVH